MFCSVAAMFGVVAAIFALSTSGRRQNPVPSVLVPIASVRPTAEKDAVEERLSSAP
jgi:hypothetical protein